MSETETVYVVLDRGESNERARVAGVFGKKVDAKAKQNEINTPFKSVTVERSTLR